MVQQKRTHPPELHLISDGRRPLHEFVQIVQQCQSFVDYVHIREKTKTAAEIVDAIQRLKAVLPPEKITVNDRVDAAIVCGIRRIHLASHSIAVESAKKNFPNHTFGCSIHSIEEARLMEQRGADYLLYGHVYATDSKPGLPPRGVKTLAQIANSAAVPVIAIGGIVPANVQDLLSAGTAGIAVMSGILDAPDPYKAAYLYRQALGGA